MCVTDGGVRPDGTLVPWPTYYTTALTEAFAASCSGSSCGAGCSSGRRPRRCSRGPIRAFMCTIPCLYPMATPRLRSVSALLRGQSRGTRPPVGRCIGAPAALPFRKANGPTAGTETVDPLEFLARVMARVPNKHQVMTRYYGYYANRARGARRAREPRTRRSRSPSRSPRRSARRDGAGLSSCGRSSRSIRQPA